MREVDEDEESRFFRSESLWGGGRRVKLKRNSEIITSWWGLKIHVSSLLDGCVIITEQFKEVIYCLIIMNLSSLKKDQDQKYLVLRLEGVGSREYIASEQVGFREKYQVRRDVINNFWRFGDRYWVTKGVCSFFLQVQICA